METGKRAAPRGRPFSAGHDPRRARGRKRKRSPVELKAAIRAAIEADDLDEAERLIRLRDQPGRTIELLPLDTSPEEIDQVLDNMRRLGMVPPLSDAGIAAWCRAHPELIPEEAARARIDLAELHHGHQEGAGPDAPGGP